MARGGGYLNIMDQGNFSAADGTLTVYAIAPVGEDDFSSLYTDDDFATRNADLDAADGGEACEVLGLTFTLASKEVVYTAKP